MVKLMTDGILLAEIQQDMVAEVMMIFRSGRRGSSSFR
jgi:HrpA-like RNA helicase